MGISDGWMSSVSFYSFDTFNSELRREIREQVKEPEQLNFVKWVKQFNELTTKEDIDTLWQEALNVKTEELTEYFLYASKLNSILNKITDDELEILYKYMKGLGNG